MEVFDAINLIRGVHRERYSIQALTANYAREALWVIRFSSGPQYTLQNGLLADGTLFQGVQVVLLAEWLVVDRIKRFSLQIYLTLTTGEALDVVDLVHGCTSRVLPHDSTTALYAIAENIAAQVVTTVGFLVGQRLLGCFGTTHQRRTPANGASPAVHVRVQ